VIGLRVAAAEHNGVVLSRLEELLTLLQQRLSADDYQKAEDLLHCTFSGVHSARRHREAAEGAK
jgi:hypothetical protein